VFDKNLDMTLVDNETDKTKNGAKIMSTHIEDGEIHMECVDEDNNTRLLRQTKCIEEDPRNTITEEERLRNKISCMREDLYKRGFENTLLVNQLADQKRKNAELHVLLSNANSSVNFLNDLNASAGGQIAELNNNIQVLSNGLFVVSKRNEELTKEVTEKNALIEELKVEIRDKIDEEEERRKSENRRRKKKEGDKEYNGYRGPSGKRKKRD
jgi:hypothetical protein